MEVAVCLLPGSGRGLEGLQGYVKAHMDAQQTHSQSEDSLCELTATARYCTLSGTAFIVLLSMVAALKCMLATAASPDAPAAVCTCCRHGACSPSVFETAHGHIVCVPFLSFQSMHY